MKLQVVNDVDSITLISDDSLWCRTESHLWRWLRDAPIAGRSAHAFTRSLACERCGAEKMKTISTRSFTVVSSRIKYPKGYLIKGSGRIPVSTSYREQYERRRVG